MKRRGEPPRIPNYDVAYHKTKPNPWGKRMCAPCVDGAHRQCLGNPCDCLCLTGLVRPAKKGPPAEVQETMERFGTIEIRPERS